MFAAVRAALRPGNPSVFANASWLWLATASGSLAGALFWVVAARNYTQSDVGLGAAYISAMSLVALLGNFGLSTAVVRFAPGMGDHRGRFVSSTMSLVALATAATSVLFCLGAPVWSPGLRAVAVPGADMVLFVGSAVAAALATLQDRILMAFESMRLLLLRNALEDGLRIVIPLTFVSRMLGGLGLGLSFGLAMAATVLLSVTEFLPRVVPGYRPRLALDLSLVRGKVGYTLGNQAAQLLWGAPALLYPLIVVDLLGARANARFYVMWMLMNLLLVVPTSVFLSIFARASNSGALPDAALWHATRVSIAVLAVGSAALALVTPFALRVFGGGYAAASDLEMPLLLLGLFPLTVNMAVATRHRYTLSTVRLVLVSLPVLLLCVGLSTLLGVLFGVLGIAMGWAAGQTLGLIPATASLAIRPPGTSAPRVRLSG